MTLTPFAYQEEGIKFLASRHRALLLDDPGLGKTLQAVRAADQVSGSLQTVCPASVVTQWTKTAEELSEYEYPKSACSYEAARDKGFQSSGILVLDELHFLKNGSSARTKAILGSLQYGVDGAIRNAGRVWGMSGTLAPRDPSDLYAPLLAIVPGALHSDRSGNTLDYWQFMKKFCVYYDTGYGMKVTKGKNLPELRDRMAPYVLRRTKKEARKDWKEPVCGTLWLEPGEQWWDPEGNKETQTCHLRELDNSVEAEKIRSVFNKGGYAALQVFARTEDTGVSRYRRFVGHLKVEGVVSWLLDKFDNGQKKIVVICYHHEVMDRIEALLRVNKIKSVKYTGEMTAKQKDSAKRAFIEKEDCAVFNGQITACGTGLDGLQHVASELIFVEWSWLDDDNEQVISRLDREGQTEPVLAWFAGLAGSLDEAITASASRRAADNETLFG